MKGAKRFTPLAERLEVLSMSTSCGCRIWLAALCSKGYGMISVGGKVRKAHRVSYEVANGVQLEPKDNVLHSCDVPACINPDHLSLGDHEQNVRDMFQRGRYKNKWGATTIYVTPELVTAVLGDLAEGMAPSEVANKHGILRPMVSNIRSGKRKGL